MNEQRSTKKEMVEKITKELAELPPSPLTDKFRPELAEMLKRLAELPERPKREFGWAQKAIIEITKDPVSACCFSGYPTVPGGSTFFDSKKEIMAGIRAMQIIERHAAEGGLVKRSPWSPKRLWIHCFTGKGR